MKTFLIIVGIMLVLITALLLIPVFPKYLWNYNEPAEKCEAVGGNLTMINSCFSTTEKTGLGVNLVKQILDEI